MATRITVYVQNDQKIYLPLTDENGAPLSGVTAIATLLDSSGNPVTGFDSLPMVESTVAGTYYAQVTEAFNPTLGSYTLKLTGSLSGLDYTAYCSVTVAKRVL